MTNNNKSTNDLFNHIFNIINFDLSFLNQYHLSSALSIAKYETRPQDGFPNNLQVNLIDFPNQAIASLGDRVLKFIRATQSFRKNPNAKLMEEDTQENESNKKLKIVAENLDLLEFAYKIVDKKVLYEVSDLNGETILATLYEAMVGAIYLSLTENNESLIKLEDFINKTINYKRITNTD